MLEQIARTKNWIEAIKRKLSGSDEQDAKLLASQEQAVFLLRYKDLVIGQLTNNAGKWRFEYSEVFRQQQELAALVNFPDKNKVYEQEVLWPFFAARIPGVSQPRVKQLIKEHHIDENDTVALLKLFGKKNISNPFQLEFQ